MEIFYLCLKVAILVVLIRVIGLQVHFRIHNILRRNVDEKMIPHRRRYQWELAEKSDAFKLLWLVEKMKLYRVLSYTGFVFGALMSVWTIRPIVNYFFSLPSMDYMQVNAGEVIFFIVSASVLASVAACAWLGYGLFLLLVLPFWKKRKKEYEQLKRLPRPSKLHEKMRMNGEDLEEKTRSLLPWIG